MQPNDRPEDDLQPSDPARGTTASGEQGHAMRGGTRRGGADGASTGDVGRDGGFSGDYSGGGRAGGLGTVGDADRREAYHGDGGQSGAQAGGPPHALPHTHSDDDARLGHDVRAALLGDVTFDASAIDVAVAAGEVTLTGTVTDARAQRLAEACLERIAGIATIRNQLQIR